MAKPKYPFSTFRMLSGRDCYVNINTMKEVTATEAFGNVVESSRTAEIIESARGGSVGLLGTSGSKSTKKRLKEAYRGLGLNKKETKILLKRDRGGN